MRKLFIYPFWLLLLVTLLSLTIINLRILSRHSWDPKSFILERSPDVPLEQGWDIGYDGQWAYLIAVNPLGSISEIDQPAYRYQRILYPLIVHVMSIGQPSMVPWMMILVNLFSASLGCFLLGKLLINRSVSPWYALVLVFSIGYLLALRMDLLEPLALSLALLGLYYYEEEHIYMAILFFSLGGLTKEIALIFPLSLMVWDALRRNWRRVYLLAGSLGLYILWYFVVNTWLGTTDNQIAKSILMLIPFSGIAQLKDPASLVVVILWVLFPAILSGISAMIDLIKNYGSDLGMDAVLVIGQVVLIASMPLLTWEDPIAILRIGLGLIIAVLLWLASSHPRSLPYAAGLWLPSSLVLFLVPGMF